MKITFRKSKKQNPDIDQNIRVSYAPKKRYFPRFRWYLILLVAASPLIYFLFSTSYDTITVTAPGYLTYNQVTIKAPHKSLVGTLEVIPGMTVKKDSPLIKLRDFELESQINALEKQQRKKESLVDEQFRKILDDLNESLIKAQSQLEFNQVQFNKIHKIYEEQEVAFAEYLEAKQQLAISQNRVYEIQIAISNEKIRIEKEKSLVPGLMEAITKRESLIIDSPISGVVSEVYAYQGESVTAGQILLTISTSEDPYVGAYLDPRDAKFAHKGKKVTVYFPAGDTRKGVVVMKPQLAKKIPSDIVGPVATRSMKMYVKIKLIGDIPLTQNVNGLPVKVRFHFNSQD